MHNNRWDVPASTHAALIRAAKQLRKAPTPSQNRLWQAVRRKSLGVRVRREQPIGPFIVDFFIASQRLIIEVDGSIHDMQERADHERQHNLESLGFRFLRVSAVEVMEELGGVIQKIRREIK